LTLEPTTTPRNDPDMTDVSHVVDLRGRMWSIWFQPGRLISENPPGQSCNWPSNGSVAMTMMQRQEGDVNRDSFRGRRMMNDLGSIRDDRSRCWESFAGRPDSVIGNAPGYRKGD